MDEMKITTGFMKALIAKAMRKVISEKLGADVDITLNDIYISNDNNGAHVHLNVKADMAHDELARFTSCIMK